MSNNTPEASSVEMPLRTAWWSWLADVATGRGQASAREYLIALLACASAGMALSSWRGGGDARSLAAIAVAALAISTVMRRLRTQETTSIVVALVLLASPTLLLVCIGLHVEGYLVGRPAVHVLYMTGWATAASFYLLLILCGSGLTQAPRKAPPLGKAASILRWRMNKQARPTLLLGPIYGPSRSMLGGVPALEADFEWPTDRSGEPLIFLAQLDLEQARLAGGPPWLPEQGWLFVFAPKFGGAEDDGSVIYRPALASTAYARPPANLRCARAVGMTHQISRPSLDWLGVDLDSQELDDDEREFLIDYPTSAFANGEPEHRIGGYPSEIQDEAMAAACALGLARDPRTPYDAYPEPEALAAAQRRAATRWRLLVQFETDPDVKFKWGDGGRLFVFVREKDAVACNFTKVRMMSQTH